LTPLQASNPSHPHRKRFKGPPGSFCPQNLHLRLQPEPSRPWAWRWRPAAPPPPTGSPPDPPARPDGAPARPLSARPLAAPSRLAADRAAAVAPQRDAGREPCTHSLVELEGQPGALTLAVRDERLAGFRSDRQQIGIDLHELGKGPVGGVEGAQPWRHRGLLVVLVLLRGQSALEVAEPAQAVPQLAMYMNASNHRSNISAGSAFRSPHS
jgi:hypothetical protein